MTLPPRHKPPPPPPPMQAIQTKYIPATTHRGARIKATCHRGSVTIGYPHHLSGDEVHREAVRSLCTKFIAQDKAERGRAITYGVSVSFWSWEFVTGTLPDGSMCHIFLPETAPLLLDACKSALEALEDPEQEDGHFDLVLLQDKLESAIAAAEMGEG